MKKALAVLLAILMAFSVCVVSVSAVDDDPGNVITIPSGGLGRIDTKSEDDTVEVQIFQGGDVLELGKVTASTTKTPKTFKVIYYPDAASINLDSLEECNYDWSVNKVPKYNLSSAKWDVGEGTDEEIAARKQDMMAKSPKHFKKFYTSCDFLKNEIARVTFLGLNDGLAHAQDDGGVDRGNPDGEPIDYTLSGAKFLGWALFHQDSLKLNKTTEVQITVYALWDRSSIAPVEKPDEPEEPDEPENPDTPVTYATPIQETLAKWLAKLAEIFQYVAMVTAVPAALAKLLEDGVKSWLYEKFGIQKDQK